MALPHTVQEADAAAVKAYHEAARGGRVPDPDSPLGRAAAKAIERQEALRPGTDFVKAVLDVDTTEQQEQARQVAFGRQVDQTAHDHRVIPQTDAGARNLASLAGRGVVDMSGGATTIATEFQSEFERRFAAAEQARAIAASPYFSEAMAKAKATAVRKGQPTAAEFAKALEEVRAERGPLPLRPPAPVTPLFGTAASTAAKSTERAAGWRPVPDRFGGK